MDQDLSNTLQEFTQLKKLFMEEKQSNCELRAANENLLKQNNEVTNILRLEERKHCNEQETALMQQKTNALLLDLKGENLRLSKQIRNLEDTISELKIEKTKLKKHCADLKHSHTKELQDTILKYGTKIQEIEKESKKHILEINKKLDKSASQKSNEMNMLLLECQKKLQILEHRLQAKENENADIQKKAIADVAIYQKKMLALEHLCNEMQMQRQEAMYPPHVPTVKHQQAPPQLPTCEADQGFQYQPPSKFCPSSSTASSTAFLCSPTDFQPDTTTTTSVQLKQPRGRARLIVSKRNISAANCSEALNKPNPATAAAEQATGLASKSTRFSIAKKRKLFSENQNTI